MRINADEIRSTVEQVRHLLQEETAISPTLRATLEMLLLVVTILLNRVGINSRNSSKPPSDDPNREKPPRTGNGNKPGGQKGHRGSNLEPVADPDEIIFLKVDPTILPKGVYREDGHCITLDADLFQCPQTCPQAVQPGKLPTPAWEVIVRANIQ